MDQSGSVTDDVMRSLLESSSDLDMEMTNGKNGYFDFSDHLCI